MITKCLEVRDTGTCIPVLAIKMVPFNPTEHTYLWRCGYSDITPFTVVLMNLSDQRATSDPYSWAGSRTYQTAHIYIDEHFDELTGG